MSLQYRRVLDLLVGDPTKGTGLTANQTFRIKFIIEKTIRHTPNHAVIQVFNLNADSAGKAKDEYTEVIVNAGYADSARLIFAGNIRRVWSYRDDAGVNQITEIRAADGDDDYRNTIVNASFKAGSTDSEILDHIRSKFSTTKIGDLSKISGAQRPRGKVISGLARSELHRIAESIDAHWSIQDGVLQFVAFEGTLPDEAIVIRADTGMLKTPELSDKGIKAWCQLNPALKCGGKVKLDNNDLREKLRKDRDRVPGAKPRKDGKLATLDPDGIYRINKLVHRGDTRDTEWISEITCTALSAPIPASGGKKKA